MSLPAALALLFVILAAMCCCVGWLIAKAVNLAETPDDDPHQSPYGDEPKLPRPLDHCGIIVVDLADFTPNGRN
jgi:hypothetical protein